MSSNKRTEFDIFLRTLNRSWLSIKQTGRKILAEMNYDLTFEQLMILHLLEERDGQNLRYLAEHADRERTTMTRMVDGLERRDLVVRVPDKSDGRNKLVYLTRKGREMLDDVRQHKSKFEKLAVTGVTKEQLAKASEVLTRICRNLGVTE
jgi:DNA-binding MarR family transcriptional regulator